MNTDKVGREAWIRFFRHSRYDMAEPEEIDLTLDPEHEPELDQQYIESDEDFICFDTEQVDINQSRPE